ncbi:MAG TPA: alpha/beta fold hydrolase [Thermoanaerobaculia bacterium]
MSRPAAAPGKSRDVRLSVFRALFRGLSPIAPAAAAELAVALFRRPPRHRASENEREALDKGDRTDLSLGGRPLAIWRWGKGPAVLLVHGWGSRGSRLASFIAPLTEAGFSVVAFDAPGHGASAGRLSSLPQFISAIRAVAREVGGVEAIIAHSMGGAATTLAMGRGLRAGRAVFLAPAADPAGYSERFAATVGLSPDVLARMRRSIERRFDEKWEDFDVLSAARTMTAPLLVFHDRNDADVAWTDGAAIASAWPGAELVSTTGLGHRRIVHDPEVVLRAVAFVTGSRAATRASGGA